MQHNTQSLVAGIWSDNRFLKTLSNCCEGGKTSEKTASTRSIDCQLLLDKNMMIDSSLVHY